MRALSAEEREWLRNPVWHALRTEHATLAVGSEQALRYPEEYIPFAGLATREPRAFDKLYELLAPGESIYITGEETLAAPKGFAVMEEIAGLQMVYAGSPTMKLHSDEPQLVPLTAVDTPELLALKEIAFPGFYGPRAPDLGTYYGIRVAGELVAMAGERLALPGLREVSAVCTHPSHTGRGYAARLIEKLVAGHLNTGLVPFLHLAASNERALALYERLGFVRSRELRFQRIRKDCLR